MDDIRITYQHAEHGELRRKIVLRFTQVINTYELRDICALTVNEGAWERLHRFHIALGRENDQHAQPGVVWIDLCDEHGDSGDDGPIAVADHHAVWLLRDIFLTRKSWGWGRVKLGLGTAAC